MFKDHLLAYNEELIRLINELDANEFEKIISILLEARKNNRTVFITGNGGSAGTANHFVCDFGKNAVLDPEKKRFKIISLCDNIEKVTALGNDFCFEEIFSQQLKNLMEEEDVLILVSASGNSPDLVHACEYAKTKNARYIDTILDRACFQVMSDSAQKLGNDYVSRYVSKLADVTNLKTLLRCWRLERREEELEESIVPGGELPAELLVRAFKNDVIQVMKETSYGTLCDTYMPQGFTVFEKACDDYLMGYVKDAKYKTLTPNDMKINKAYKGLCANLIIDGKIMHNNLKNIKKLDIQFDENANTFPLKVLVANYKIKITNGVVEELSLDHRG